MSYGQKPSAWARPQGGQQQLNPSLFGNQLGLGPGQPFTGIPGMPGLAGLVNQAAFTNTMNMGAMNSMLAQAQRSQMMPPQQQQMQSARQQQQQQQSSPARSQRAFIGQVTKLMETYGFVDEDVFFQTNVIRGSMPRVGDRVMVEATYNPSMPFKWNANRIQLIPENQPHQMSRPVPQQQNGTSTGNRWSGGERMVREEPRRQPPPVVRRSPPREPAAKRPISRQRSPPRRSPARKREVSLPRRQELPLKRDREERVAADRGDRDRGDSTARARSPAHSVKRDTDSPPRRRQRIIPRYHCNLPKQIIPLGDYTYANLHRRYDKLYIPSDFICSEFDWIQSIHLEQPIKFSPYPITFHVLHKDVDIPLGEGEQLPTENPPDADYRYTIKILLISHPGLSVLRQKMSGLLPDGSIDESTETQSLLKNIHLLVGHRGKAEYMCIGGAWSPSLDGPEPLHPQTMVKTAVRCARALTGLDLSNCSKWYKMLHLRYYRVERQRVDTVTLMLPDTGAVPGFKVTDESFQAVEQAHRDQLTAKLAAIDAEVFCPPNQQQQIPPVAQEEKNDEAAQQNVAVDGSQDANGGGQEQTQNVVVPPSQEQSAAMDGTETATTAVSATAPEAMDTTTQSSEHEQQNVMQDPQDGAGKKEGPTHWTVLEPNIRAMKVAELREELELRGLDSKGLKNLLMQRLLDAVEKEKEADPKKEDQSVVAASVTDNVQSTGSEQQGQTVQPDQQAAEQVPTSADPTQTEANAEATQVATTTTESEPQKEKQSIVVKIKEEIVELMETDEAAGDMSEKKEETDEEKEAREKAEKERQELEKAKEKFEKDKKERKASLERHYGQISKEQGIFVYPSKTAKSGKFDCKLMSLHSLLDYRPDDSKEASFEVFLFAESLKEVLDRSNAFTVYHTISTAMDKDAEKKRRNEALAEACRDDDVVILDDAAAGAKKDEKTKEGGTEKAGGEKQKSPNSVDLRNNFKALVHDMDTFTAFAHFDTNICGYLTDRDIEEILHSVGLDLSRAEVQRLVKKLSSKERVNYRDLTDKWVDKDGNVKYIPTPTYENSIQSFEEHAKGHLEKSEPVVEQNDGAPKQMEQNNATDTSIVFFKGMMVNVKHCLEQQTAMEQERQLVLDKNEQLELQLNTTKEQRDQLEKKKRRLEDDLDRYKKKLHETERNLKKEQDDNSAGKKSLLDCKRYGERILGIVDSILPPPKSKEEKEKSVTKTAKESSVAASNDNGAAGANSEVVLLDGDENKNTAEEASTDKNTETAVVEIPDENQQQVQQPQKDVEMENNNSTATATAPEATNGVVAAAASE